MVEVIENREISEKKNTEMVVPGEMGIRNIGSVWKIVDCPVWLEET